jgi:hypothetical protein
MTRAMRDSVLRSPLLSLHGQNKKRAFEGQVKYLDTEVIDIVVHARSLLIQHGPARVAYLDQYTPVLGVSAPPWLLSMNLWLTPSSSSFAVETYVDGEADENPGSVRRNSKTGMCN